MACKCTLVCGARRIEADDSGDRSRARPKCRINLEHVAGLPLFEGIAPGAVAELLSGASVVTPRRKTLLFSAGSPADCFYIVLGGRVKLFAMTPEGKDSIVEIFDPVSSFAEAAMFASGSFPLSAEVLEDATLIRVDAQSFQRRLRQDRELAFKMLAALSRWNRRLQREISHLKQKTPVQRVGAFLLSLTDATDGTATVSLPFKKGIVASRIGINSESFSRVLARLRKIGVETAGSTVHIHDVARLRQVCEQGMPE